MAQDPKRNTLLVAMGMGPKRNNSAPPSSLLDQFDQGGTAAPQIPSSSAPQQPQQQQQPGALATEEEAGFSPSENCCGDCNHYVRDQGTCQKVKGPKKCGDTCFKYFEPVRPQESGLMIGIEPDSDDLGGHPGI